MSPEVVRARSVAGLALAASLVAAACASASPDAEHPFETVVSQTQSGLAERRREVVRDAAAWARVWAEIQSSVVPAPPLPAVDFAREMLVVVASGTRPSGGYAIKVRSVATRGDKLEVAVHEDCPAPGAMVIMVLTQPVEVVRVQALAQAPGFQETRAASCR